MLDLHTYLLLKTGSWHIQLISFYNEEVQFIQVHREYYLLRRFNRSWGRGLNDDIMRAMLSASWKKTWKKPALHFISDRRYALSDVCEDACRQSHIRWPLTLVRIRILEEKGLDQGWLYNCDDCPPLTNISKATFQPLHITREILKQTKVTSAWRRSWGKKQCHHYSFICSIVEHHFVSFVTRS